MLLWKTKPQVTQKFTWSLITRATPQGKQQGPHQFQQSLISPEHSPKCALPSRHRSVPCLSFHCPNWHNSQQWVFHHVHCCTAISTTAIPKTANERLQDFSRRSYFSLSFLTQWSRLNTHSWKSTEATESIAHRAWPKLSFSPKSLDMAAGDGRWGQTERKPEPQTQTVGASVVLLSRRHRLETGRNYTKTITRGVTKFLSPRDPQAWTCRYVLQAKGWLWAPRAEEEWQSVQQ